MFTGIVTATARILSWDGPEACRRLALERPGGVDWADLEIGESLCVGGVCLTLVEESPESMSFDVVRETLEVSIMGDRRVGDLVNLERSLRLGDRLGGHLVYGHVDAIGTVLSRTNERGDTRLEIESQEVAGGDFAVIFKGSVTIDGVSLTVASCDERSFGVTLVPHTLEVTTLGTLEPGHRVNLEMDPMGRWVRNWLQASRSEKQE